MSDKPTKKVKKIARVYTRDGFQGMTEIEIDYSQLEEVTPEEFKARLKKSVNHKKKLHHLTQ